MPSQGSYLAVVLEDALGAHGLEVAPVEGFSDVFTGAVTGAIGQWSFFAQPDEASLGVLMYSIFPAPTPEHRRQAVAELAARANYLLHYGDLEMDFADGEVRARTSACGGSDPVDFNTVSELVRANLEVADLLFPLVQEVALEGKEPAAAIAGLLERLAQA